MKTHLSIYATFRSYVQHEDDLINNRLNWNFTIQGFLFAAYTFSLQKISEIRGNLLLHLQTPSIQTTIFNSQVLGLRELRIAMVMIALVGLWVSFWVYMSVSAARIAIEELVGRWHQEYLDYKPNPEGGKQNTHGSYLPGLVGGGDLNAHGLGLCPSCVAHRLHRSVVIVDPLLANGPWVVAAPSTKLVEHCSDVGVGWRIAFVLFHLWLRTPSVLL